ncbi:polysaccharide biosynthesis protein [Lacihabitans sp. LS3-19]|uniref:lipopolysaccharide biosynthesis protein n=1 Tax=Lacihabitans sp. LS3-19 TaxID=2487335 RepID=UPI0020CB76DD|nr:hypothetical protein [Lacihabitans sp. LS3-19]MCP9767653.1 polysaccharide biosynthesis protein [Lacihabitans sp. LS3-19]
MGLIIRQSVKSSVGYFIGVILGAINTLFIATHFLSADELAVSRLLLENSLIFATFVHLGSPYIIDKFFARFKNENNGNNGMLLLMLLFPLIGFLVFLVPLIFINDEFKLLFLAKSPTVIPYLWLSLPMSLFWAVLMVFEAYSRANKRVAMPTFLRETVFRALNIISIIIYGLGYINFSTFLLFNVFFILIIIISLIIYLIKLGKFQINFNFLNIEKRIIKDAVKFGGLVIIGSLGVNLIMFIDRNIIAQKIGTQAVAIFVISSYIANTIEIPAKALKSISVPILSENLFHLNFKKVNEIYKKSALNLMLIGGIMLVLVSVNIEAILNLLPKKEIYSQGKWIVIIISLAKWIEMSLGLNNEVISYSKYYKFNTILVIFMAISVVLLNYFLIPILGLLGSAFATALVTLFSGIFRLFFVQSKFGMNPLTIKEFFIVIFLCFLILIGYIIPDFGQSAIALIGGIVFKSLIIISIFSFVLLKYNISQDLTYMYLNFKKKFK